MSTISPSSSPTQHRSKSDAQATITTIVTVTLLVVLLLAFCGFIKRFRRRIKTFLWKQLHLDNPSPVETTATSVPDPNDPSSNSISIDSSFVLNLNQEMSGNLKSNHQYVKAEYVEAVHV
jgi:ABC-type phosphate transport system substrate-binding protein